MLLLTSVTAANVKWFQVLAPDAVMSNKNGVRERVRLQLNGGRKPREYKLCTLPDLETMPPSNNTLLLPITAMGLVHNTDQNSHELKFRAWLSGAKEGDEIPIAMTSLVGSRMKVTDLHPAQAIEREFRALAKTHDIFALVMADKEKVPEEPFYRLVVGFPDDIKRLVAVKRNDANQKTASGDISRIIRGETY